MSVMGPDGKILFPGGKGKWWSPFGDTDEEIQENMKIGKMPNAPDAMRVGPRTITGSKKRDNRMLDSLGKIGALAGSAEESYQERKRNESDSD